MPVNSQLLQQIAQGWNPVTPPDPTERYKLLAQARAGMQGEEINAINIQNARQEQSDGAAAREKAARVLQAIEASGGDWAKALPGIKAVDPAFGMSVEKSLLEQRNTQGQIDDRTSDNKLEGEKFRETQLVNNAKARQDRLTLESTEAQRATVAEQNRINADASRRNQDRMNQDRTEDNRRQDARDAQTAADAKAGRENQMAIAQLPARAGVGVPTPGAGMGDSISDALGRATMTMPQTRRNQTIRTVNDMIARGDEKQARDTIRQAALESEPVAVRQQVMGRREVVNSLTDIQTLLKKVPQNLLVGTVEDVARKLGTSTNTDYVKLGNRLALLNQSYRRSMTGAQFSIPEAQEYGRIFPNYSTTAPVNQALIESLIDAFGANDSTFWKYKLGPGWSDADASGPKTGGASKAPAGIDQLDWDVMTPQERALWQN